MRRFSKPHKMVMEGETAQPARKSPGFRAAWSGEGEMDAGSAAFRLEGPRSVFILSELKLPIDNTWLMPSDFPDYCGTC